MRLEDKHIFTVPAQTSMYRVTSVDSAYSPTQLNPHSGFFWKNEKPYFLGGRKNLELPARDRFTPFRYGSAVVPSIYLAETKDVAIQEAVFRPRSQSEPRIIDLSVLSNKSVHHFQYGRDLKFALLSEVFMQGGADPLYPFEYQDIASPITLKSAQNGRDLAQLIHNSNPGLDGICWESIRHPGQRSFVLWSSNTEVKHIGSEIVFNMRSTWVPMVHRLVTEKLIMIDPKDESLRRL